MPGRPRQYRTTKQFLRAFHLTSLEDLPVMPDLGGEGQMRLNEVGEVVDAAEGVESGYGAHRGSVILILRGGAAVAALWIFAVLAVLLLLLCLIRVGVLVRFGNELIVTVRLGVFRFQVFPEKKRAKEKQKPKRKPPQSAKGKKQAFPKPTFSDVREAAGVLWPSIKKALGRSRRGIRIDPMELSVVLGGQEEPADAAQQYGTLQGTVWTVVPALEQLLVLPHPRIHIDIDFSAETVRASGQVGLSARIGTLVRIGLTLAIPALRWLLTYLKKKKQRPARKDGMTDGNGKEKSAA